ncbi:aquaporin [Candidatus Bathyarchaeota archaeon]|nr:aquaporin [Candidatus Bathyarchaeota archaeon]
MSNEPDLARKYVAELLGTFLFVFVGAGSAVASFTFDPGASLLIGAFANGIGLAVAVSATMSISGGHLNPAVTIGLWLGKKTPAKDVIPYIVAQLVGATIAGLVLISVLPAATGSAVHWGAPGLNTITIAQGTVFELVMTFFLVLAIYGTAVDKRAPKIGGFGIGLTVLADVLVGGPFTGAAMNPARAMGPMLASLAFPSYWYIYWIGPVIGSILASLIYSRFIESKAA